MSISQIIQLVCLVVPLLFSIIGFVISIIKIIKSGKRKELAKTIKGYITEAENIKDYSGEQKKAYVISAAEDFCKQINFKFDLSFVIKIIEEIIDLTKKVNYLPKDEKEVSSPSANFETKK